MATTINSPMEFVTPVYNSHTHIIELQDSINTSLRLNEGRLFYKLSNSNPGGSEITKYNFWFSETINNICNVSVNNNLTKDTMFYEFSLQPTRQNELLVLQGFFSYEQIIGSSTLDSKFMLQNILASYNQWAYILNNTFTNNYFYFTVFFNKDLYDSKTTILFEDWKDICYVKYVPIKGVYYTLDFTHPVIDSIEYTSELNPSEVLLLHQPNYKLEVHLGTSQFPSISKTYNKIFEYQVPIDKDINGNYKNYIDINRIMRRYLHTDIPVVGNVKPQEDYMKSYWFSATENGNTIKNNKYTSLITQEDVTNFDRNLISLELDNEESSVKWVCNAAKDKLSLYTMKDYYKNDTTIVPLALTNQPILKESYFCNDNFNNSREFVSFIHTGALIQEVTVYVKVVFDDGTTTNLTKVIKVINPKLTNTYTVDVSPDVIGLRELDNQNIYSWEIRLASTTQTVVIPGDEQDGLRLNGTSHYLLTGLIEIVPAAVESAYTFSSILSLKNGIGGVLFQNYYNVGFDQTSGICIYVDKVGTNLVITFKAVIYQFFNEISKTFTIPNYDFSKFICLSCIKTTSRTATDLKCYVNGQEITSSVITDNIPGSVSTIARRANGWIGWIQGVTPTFSGDLFDMQIHLSALTELQHASYYNSKMNANPSTGINPTIRINFNERDGGQAKNTLSTTTGFYDFGLYNYTSNETTQGNPDCKWITVKEDDTIIPGTTTDLVKPLSYKRMVNGLPNRFNILFINQLGMWDTFTFTGDNDFNYNQKYNRYRASQAISYTPNDLISGNYNSEVTRGYSFKSSQLDKKHIQWLQELLDSPEIRVFDNNKLECYYINKSDIKFDSNKSLYTINLDLVRTIENNSINN